MNTPAGLTFRSVVELVAQAPCDFPNFKPEELDGVIREAKFRAKTIESAILQVRLITAIPNAVRPYDVKKNDDIYQLTIK